ncbi:MAG: Nif11-like leader peptide family natural product precursor [Clostridia bacterium]|nr:Nif11-like leader peptide family natural product precursor [Clostridia bacterium]
MKDVQKWTKELQENKSYAKEYKSLKNVEAIIKKAKQDGYNISKEDLKDVDLDKIAGGWTLNISINKLNMNTSASGNNSQATNSSNITFVTEQ